MTAFEQYLISQGFERFEFNAKLWKLEPAKGYLLSSMGNLDYRYIHYQNPKFQIIFGLHEKDRPATLIYPRPNIVSNDVNKFSDDAMNRALAKYTPEQVFKAIFDRCITLEV